MDRYFLGFMICFIIALATLVIPLVIAIQDLH